MNSKTRIAVAIHTRPYIQNTTVGMIVARATLWELGGDARLQLGPDQINLRLKGDGSVEKTDRTDKIDGFKMICSMCKNVLFYLQDGPNAVPNIDGTIYCGKCGKMHSFEKYNELG